MFLYILQFHREAAFKIGIAKNYNRITSHKRTYGDIGIDYDNSYIISAKDPSDIRALEIQLLADFSEYKLKSDTLAHRDGYTEILRTNALDGVIGEISRKAELFPKKGLILQKGISYENIETNANKSRQGKQKMKKYDGMVDAIGYDWPGLKRIGEHNEEYKIKYIKYIKNNSGNINSIKIYPTSIIIEFANLDEAQYIEGRSLIKCSFCFEYEKSYLGLNFAWLEYIHDRSDYLILGTSINSYENHKEANEWFLNDFFKAIEEIAC